MPPVFQAIPTDKTRRLQSGGRDAYGHTPERAVSDGAGVPCRHCLKDIPKGAGMLILAYCPFDALGPYSETGPIFLCADPCMRHSEGPDLPPVLTTSPDYLVKGYNRQDRIVYGTGRIVPGSGMVDACREMLAREDVAYLHVRSARNNCYQAKVVRG